ncbi:MAG: hypothetical protein RIB93_11000 [Coleofasciculus sp. D1-CHI-01]
MFETIIVFVLGLTPPVLSIWVMHRAKEQAQIRLRNSIQAFPLTERQNPP